MIEVKPVVSGMQVPFSFDPMKGEAAFAAYEKGQFAGYCVYKKGLDTVKLLRLETSPKDLLVADIIVRSLLSVCEDTATWAECAGEGEIQDYCRFCPAFKDGVRARISDLYSGCCG